MKALFLCLSLLGAPVLLSSPTQAQPTKNLLKAPLEWPKLRAGNEYAPTVGAVQYLLRGKGFYKGKIDGFFGPKTVAAVKAFQKSRGLATDGIAGPKTLPFLVSTVKRGSSGDAVRAAQLLVRGATGHEGQTPYATLEADGIFGLQTQKAVKWAQATQNQFDKRLVEDGIMGPRTWCLLLGGEVVGQTN